MLKNRKLTYSVLSLLLLLIVGIIHFPVPFGGDQAFFLLGAKEMHDGLILYKDFWDIKQPGIFYFYYTGASLFGYNFLGIRIFELLYWIIFSFICHSFFTQCIYKTKPFQAFLPSTMTVVSYYGLSYFVHLTQVEIIANFPILLLIISNYLFLYSPKKKSLWLIISGVCFGVILLLKLIFLPLILSLYLLLFAFWVKQKDFNIKHLSKIGYVALGTSLIVLPFILYCYKNNITELCYSTFFEYPPKIVKSGYHKDISVLFISFVKFFKKVPLFLPFFLLGVFKTSKKDFFHLNIIVWFIVGLAIILIQKTSWFQYHFYLLYAPLVLITIHGCEYFIDNFNNIPFWGRLKIKKIYITIFVYLFINLPTLFYITIKLGNLSEYNFCLNKKDYLAFSLSNQQNKEAYSVSRSLIVRDSTNCPIFVVNDPLVYYYTNRNQAISQSGWSMQLFIKGQFELLLSELKDKQPCYIFIDKDFSIYFDIYNKNVANWIKENYTEDIKTEYGSWLKFKQHK